MHQPIRDSLEEYLSGLKHKIPQSFYTHVQACKECASELKLLEQQSLSLRALEWQEEHQPAPGFYARVMGRIEDQARASFWLPFLDPRFGRRLAVASAALIVLLATYLVTTESKAPDLAPPATAVVNVAPASDESAQSDSIEQQQQRDAVLVDLASYHE